MTVQLKIFKEIPDQCLIVRREVGRRRRPVFVVRGLCAFSKAPTQGWLLVLGGSHAFLRLQSNWEAFR